MCPVSSSNVQAIGYDPASRTLRVQFVSGTYEYPNISAAQHTELMAASSIGSHSAKHFRTNPNHPHRKVESQEAA